MREFSTLDRMMLLGASLLAAYQIAIGIEGLDHLAITVYTIAFGVMLVSGLLLIIFGVDVLDISPVVVASALIPLCLSLGLVIQYLPTFQNAYLTFIILGLIAILITRYLKPGITATTVLSIVHGFAGLVITCLPTLFVLRKEAQLGFIVVGFGGALIGVGGLLLFFLKAGKPLLAAHKVLSFIPTMLLSITTCFVVGMAWG
jgi:hypothetical protein